MVDDSKRLYKADKWVVGSPYSWVLTSPNKSPVRDLVLHFKFFKSRVVERKGECVRLARVGLKI